MEPETAASEISLGGPGGAAHSGIRDTRLLEKALTNRWPMQPAYRAAVVNRLMQIVADKGSSKREATSAAKALIAAEGQNQADEQHADRLTIFLIENAIDAELQRIAGASEPAGAGLADVAAESQDAAVGAIEADPGPTAEANGQHHGSAVNGSANGHA